MSISRLASSIPESPTLKLNDAARRLRVKGEPVVVESYGKPMAVVLSYEEYQRYLQYRHARAERFARLRRVAAENASAGRLSEKEASSLVHEVRQEIYEESNRGE